MTPVRPRLEKALPVWDDPRLAAYFRGAPAVLRTCRFAPSCLAVRDRLIWHALARAGEVDGPAPTPARGRRGRIPGPTEPRAVARKDVTMSDVTSMDNAPIAEPEMGEEDDAPIELTVRRMPAPTTDAQAHVYQAAIEAEARLLALVDAPEADPQALHVAESEVMALNATYDRLLRASTGASGG